MPPDTSSSVTNSARGTLAVAWRTTELWRLSDTIRERRSFIGRLGTADSAQGRVNRHTEAMCTLSNPPISRFIFVLIIHIFCRPTFLKMSYSSSHDGFKHWYDQQFKILTYYSLGEYGSGKYEVWPEYVNDLLEESFGGCQEPRVTEQNLHTEKLARHCFHKG